MALVKEFVKEFVFFGGGAPCRHSQPVGLSRTIEIEKGK
jgi:hypothetical protein